jgi:hypothetical protein
MVSIPGSHSGGAFIWIMTLKAILTFTQLT